MIGISRGDGHRVRCPGLRACEAAARVLPGSTVPGLHRAIAPPPLPAKSKIHSGLDRDPVSSGIKVNWRRNSDAKGAATQRIRHRETFLG